MSELIWVLMCGINVVFEMGINAPESRTRDKEEKAEGWLRKLGLRTLRFCTNRNRNAITRS